MKLRLLMVVLCGALLASCAAVPPEKRGYVLLSVGPGYEPPLFTEYRVVVRAFPNGPEAHAEFDADRAVVDEKKADYVDGKAPGSVFLLALAPGDYELLRYQTSPPRAFSMPMSERFQIVEGTTVYLGRFRISLQRVGPPALLDGIPPGRTARGERTDRFDEDVALARRKYPEELKAYPVTGRSSAEPAEHSPPFATVHDSGEVESHTRAKMFVLTEIDGQSVHDSVTASRSVGQGQGSLLTTWFIQRAVPARPMKVKLVATHAVNAPIEELGQRMAGTFFKVEGIFDFAPAPNGTYVVRGELRKEGSTVWIEDAKTKQRVTTPVTGQKAN